MVVVSVTLNVWSLYRSRSPEHCKKTGQVEVTFAENVRRKMGHVWHRVSRIFYFLLVKYILKKLIIDFIQCI
jgi:hypothetical protein